MASLTEQLTETVRYGINATVAFLLGWLFTSSWQKKNELLTPGENKSVGTDMVDRDIMITTTNNNIIINNNSKDDDATVTFNKAAGDGAHPSPNTTNKSSNFKDGDKKISAVLPPVAAVSPLEAAATSKENGAVGNGQAKKASLQMGDDGDNFRYARSVPRDVWDKMIKKNKAGQKARAAARAKAIASASTAGTVQATNGEPDLLAMIDAANQKIRDFNDYMEASHQEAMDEMDPFMGR